MAEWRAERGALQAVRDKAESDAAAAAVANAELQQGLAALEAAGREGLEAGAAELRAKYADTVRRMAVVQVWGRGGPRSDTALPCTHFFLCLVAWRSAAEGS